MMKLEERPKVPDCPKNLFRCVKASCTKWGDCWAYDRYVDSLEKDKAKRDDGWE